MEVLYLGHAGFLITDHDSSIIVDPWLSENGAFNRAWHQFPCNHHLRAALGDRIANQANRRIILSHEHADHFCRETLADGVLRPIGIVIPSYREKGFHHAVQELRGGKVVEMTDGVEVHVGTLHVSFIIDDSGMDRDAGIMIRNDDGQTFLNFNDCKAFDRIPDILNSVGPIDLFTCQFSGAIRHPVCYEYDDVYYISVAEEKRQRKFDTVHAAIEAIRPRLFFPSAGPCIFLDPALFHLNLGKYGLSFSKSWEFIEFLERHHKGQTRFQDLMAGDTISWTDARLEVSRTTPAVSAATYVDYLNHRQRECWQSPSNPRTKSLRLESSLLTESQEKLNIYRRLAPHINVAQDLYFQILPDEAYIKVDFSKGEIRKTEGVDSPAFLIHRFSWEEIAAIYEDGLGWDGHALTFRFSTRREPDVYDPVIDLFLTSGADKFRDGLRHLCEVQMAADTIIVASSNGQKYRIKRYCPHLGADLLGARVEGTHIICPRHGWRFNLENGGLCPSQGCDIAAQPI